MYLLFCQWAKVIVLYVTFKKNTDEYRALDHIYRYFIRFLNLVGFK